MNSNYPLKGIPAPHPHDGTFLSWLFITTTILYSYPPLSVLCGRGGGTNAHVGNSHWRMLVTANKELYVTLPKRQKMLLSKSIVNAVRTQNPPGRFLQKDPKTDLWYDVGDQRAQEKTSQALREGAPEIREKLKSPDAAAMPSPAERTAAEPYSVDSSGHFEASSPVVMPIGSGIVVPPSLPPVVEPQGPVPVRKRSSKKSDFESVVVEPPSGLDPDQQFSMGSMAMMSDMEQAKLMNGCSIGTTMSYLKQPDDEQDLEPYPLDAQQHVHFTTGDHPEKGAVAPVDGGLEPAGLSFGSVMSLGTVNTADLKLETAGLSFGSLMSYSVADNKPKAPEAVDGGLEAIGTSFGSLSLATTDKERLIASLEEPKNMPPVLEAAPTFLRHEKSRGSLLACSDTDSDDEESSSAAQQSQNKSAEWEKLKATLAAQNYTASASTAPPLFGNHHHMSASTNLHIPTTNFDREMSAISVGDDFGEQVMPFKAASAHNSFSGDAYSMPPPPAMKKGESEEWETAEQLEYALLNRGGDSLAAEDFALTN